MEIRIIATDPKFKRAPYFVTPIFDEKTKTYKTGQEWDKDPEKAKKQKEGKFVIDPEEQYPLKHGMILNTDVETDSALLNLFKLHDTILAPSKKSVIPGVHFFFIENKEDEAVESVSKAELEYEAMTTIKGLSLSQLQDLARVIGVPQVSKLSKVQVEAALITKAKANPGEFMKSAKDPNSKVKAFLRKLVDKNILRLNAGKYMYQNEIIGLNEQAVIDYLKNKDNANMVSEFDRLLKQTEPVTA